MFLRKWKCSCIYNIIDSIYPSRRGSRGACAISSLTTTTADYDYKATVKVAVREHSEHAKVVAYIKKQEARLDRAGVNVTAMFSALVHATHP